MSRRKREVAAKNAFHHNKKDRADSGSLTVAVAKQIGIVVIPLLLVLGTLAAISGKYKLSLTPGNVDSAASAAPPVQTGTPPLSKEYIYTGGKMLATVDGTSNIALNSVSGKAIYGTTPANETPKFVSGVSLSLNPGEPLVTTEAGGSYQMTLAPGANYTFTASKYAYTQINGITAFDATLVLRHVAAGGTGSNALNANQQIAGDTDGDNSVTAFDATQILRFVAANGPTGTTGQTGYWRFAPATRSYQPFSSSLANENYYAILVGELDGDWDTAASPSYASTYDVQIYPESSTAAQGSTIVIPVLFSKNSAQAVGAYSFHFRFDPAILQPNYPAISASGTLSANCQVVSNESWGTIGVSANCGSSPISTSSGTLMKLGFTVIGDPDTYTSLWFNYVTTGNQTPMFESTQGNLLTTYPYGAGSFTVESAPEQLASGDSLPIKKSDNSSAAVAGKVKAFVPAVEQAQQQEQQLETEEMRISLPVNAATMQGGTLTIPVTLTNNNNKELSAFSFDVQFNPAFLQPAGVASDTAGTLSSNCKAEQYSDRPGRISIAGACAGDITASSGTLLKLRFTVKKKPKNASQQARALKFGQIPRFVNHHGKQLGVGRADGSIR